MTKKVFIATPAFANSYYGDYTSSLVNLIAYAARTNSLSVNWKKWGDSSICRARNTLCAMFMRSDCDYLFWIDADIGFSVEQFMRVLDSGYDIATAAYPLKNYFEVDFNNMPNDLSWDEFKQLMTLYVTNTTKETFKLNDDNFMRVLDAGTGFMCIHRSVIEKMYSDYPELAYHPDKIDTKKEVEYALFMDALENYPGLPGKRRYLSEDYAFCRRAQQSGFDVWLDVDSKLTHCGPYQFEGDFRKHLEAKTKKSNWDKKNEKN